MLEQLKFIVRWSGADGVHSERGFYTRENAVRFLNYLILDCGYADAKLHRVRFSNPPRITFSSNGKRAS